MIAPVSGGPDVHLPRSSLQGTSRLLPGQRVGYTVRESSIGPWAADVILIR
jgi:cold shock CspA family protein